MSTRRIAGVSGSVMNGLLAVLAIAIGPCHQQHVPAQAQPKQAPVDPTPVALWLFDDPLGASTAVDSSGHGYHLTLGPGAAIVGGGKYGSALDADASEGHGLGLTATRRNRR